MPNAPREKLNFGITRHPKTWTHIESSQYLRNLQKDGVGWGVTSLERMFYYVEGMFHSVEGIVFAVVCALSVFDLFCVEE